MVTDQKWLDLQKYLNEKLIDAEIIDLKMPMPTSELAAKYLGCAVSDICKTLILKVNKQVVAVILRGDAKIDFTAVAALFKANPKRIRFASSETAGEITGYPPGGTPPLGFKNEIPVLLDKKLYDEDRTIYAGGGRLEHLLKIKPSEIAEKTEAIVAAISF